MCEHNGVTYFAVDVVLLGHRHGLCPKQLCSLFAIACLCFEGALLEFGVD